MIVWTGFLLLVLFFLALDLGVFNRTPHKVSTKEAVGWTSLWIGVSLVFSGFIYFAYREGWVANPEELSAKAAVLKYLTGYLVEKSLSMDNIFVIAMIFSYFRVPDQYQHRVLFWGILGALVFRGIMIGVGVILIQRFAWLTYVFGAFLLYSAYKMWTTKGSVKLEDNPVLRFLRRRFPISYRFEGDQFFIKKMGKRIITPLFVALIMVELTDIMFAFDSIPAIFAITTDPFLVFTSNIFAILGLRSLYFVLASVMDKFKYLQHALVAILVYVGIKMLIVHHVHIPEWLSLLVIALSLSAGILFSIWRKPEIMEQSTEPDPSKKAAGRSQSLSEHESISERTK